MNLTPKGLLKRKAITIQDLLVKVENEDWHGVQDCASDIREIEAALRVYNATDPKLTDDSITLTMPKEFVDTFLK